MEAVCSFIDSLLHLSAWLHQFRKPLTFDVFPSSLENIHRGRLPVTLVNRRTWDAD